MPAQTKARTCPELPNSLTASGAPSRDEPPLRYRPLTPFLIASGVTEPPLDYRQFA